MLISGFHGGNFYPQKLPHMNLTCSEVQKSLAWVIQDRRAKKPADVYEKEKKNASHSPYSLYEKNNMEIEIIKLKITSSGIKKKMIHTSKDAQATAAIWSCGQNPWKAQLREATSGLTAGPQNRALLSRVRNDHTPERHTGRWPWPARSWQLGFLTDSSCLTGAWLPSGTRGGAYLLAQETGGIYGGAVTGLSLESKFWTGWGLPHFPSQGDG